MMASYTTISPSERHAISLNRLTPLFLAAILAFLPALSLVWAAPPVTAKQNAQQDDTGAVAPGQIGNSGFVVPVPEINMKSIIGNQPPKKVEPTAPSVQESPPVKEPPAVEQTPAAEESRSQERESEFDEPPPPAEIPAATPVKKPRAPTKSREQTSEPEQAVRLPFDPSYRTGPGSTQQVGQPVRSVPEKKIESPLASPPVAPEETIQAPLPKKEVLKGKVAITPPNLLEAAPVKGSAKTNSIERMTIDGGDSAIDSIPFAQRKEPEAMPAEPAKPPAKVADVGRPEPPAPEPTWTEPPVAEPSRPAPSVPEPQIVEPPAPQPAPEPVEETPRPEEPPAVKEPPTPPPPTRIASPLDTDALRSRDVKDYLTQTSPILEELSLLMTRAPSLAIADFDPSDPNAVIFPKEIYVKIDAMKRALQILDSKAFAIIPPAKYATFHSVIRDSIIQTYQACDAMINYFNERNDENLQKVHDHLMKARELVQKTHLAQG